MKTENTNPKILALAAHLECEPNELTESTYDENRIEYGRDEYLVLTDDEADDIASQYIKDTLWAFNTEFISSHTKHGLDDEQEKAIAEMQGKLCESANPIISAMIENMDLFIEDAICADGRGHFISQHDGDEVESQGYYIYRQN